MRNAPLGIRAGVGLLSRVAFQSAEMGRSNLKHPHWGG
jgi:hypothetical protein